VREAFGVDEPHALQRQNLRCELLTNASEGRIADFAQSGISQP